MKIITLSQPYATLVAEGVKTIETRSWKTPYRGPIAIHAGRITRDAIFDCGHAPAIMYLIRAGYITPGPKQLPWGSIVATAEIQAIWPMKDMLRPDGSWIAPTIDGEYTVEKPDIDLGFWHPTRYAWFLHNIQMLPEPIPWKGAQGLREFDPAVLKGGAV